MNYPTFLAATTSIAVALAVAVAAADSIPRSASELRAELLAVPLSAQLGGETTRVIATDKAFTFLAANAPFGAATRLLLR